MPNLSIKLGFWSTLLGATALIIFTICFVILLLTAPLFMWTNLDAYLSYVNSNNQFLQHLARLMSLLLGPLFVLALNSIHDYAEENKKALTRASLAFGLAFAVLTGINYFVQLSSVRLNILKGTTDGLIQVVQGNPYSAVSAINMLGWTLFLGLASLFVAPVFGGGRLENVIKVTFLLNGVFCLLGGFAYVLEITPLLFVTINLGMGGAFTLALITLTLFFKRRLAA